MIRITGGQWRGRAIESPPRTKDIRPTTALMRESIFSSVQQDLPGARFLDLFGGSGIMGIEALSRGAAFVLAVEADARQCRAIRESYEKLGLKIEQAKAVPVKVEALMAKPCREEAFDVVFLDPPYGFNGLAELVTQLLANGWVKPDGVVIVEHGSREADLPGFTRRIYGDSSLSMRRIAG